MEWSWQDVSSFAGNWGQAIGSLLTACAIWLGYLELKRSEARDVDADADELETRQLEIYQRLELESLTVFRYETDHRNLIYWYKTHLAPSGLPPFLEPIEEANLCARKYYEMSCNLFEIAIRLREKTLQKDKKGHAPEHYVEDDVFGSWVAWFFDVVCEWGFRAVWAELRDNYTPTLRDEVFDPLVAELIAKWDVPHDQVPQSELRIDDDVLNAVRHNFYLQMGERFECSATKEWLNRSRAKPFPIHPRAYI